MLSAYLEDQNGDLRFQAISTSRFHLRFLIGSGFPFTPKVKLPGADGTFTLVDGQRHSRRAQNNFRFDIGLTQSLEIWGRKIELREELANIYDDSNVST